MATWRSLLCSGWSHPLPALEIGNGLGFNEDGTGRLHCGAAPAAYISAKFTWKPASEASASILQQLVDPEKEAETTIDIELTLSKDLVDNNETFICNINERNLTAAAFQPKMYKLQIAKGKFTADRYLYFNNGPRSDEDNEVVAAIVWWFDFRIVFDKSPNPPLEEWAVNENTLITQRAIRRHKFWEMRDFYRGTADYDKTDGSYLS